MTETRKPVLTRSSLACLSCRSRHQKCDAKKPQCSRCSEADRECLYTRSRRGANGTTSAREELRRRKEVSTPFLDLDEYSSSLITPPEMETFLPVNISEDLASPTFGTSDGAFHVGHATSLSATTTSKRHVGTIESDCLVDAYYKNFHRFHPLLVPRRHLVTLLDDPGWKSRLEPLLAVVRLIGNLYFSQKWSTELQQRAQASIEQSPMTDPIRVQCHLLYSVVLFWQDQKTTSQTEMAGAVEIALQLNMFEKEFALEHCGGDMVLAESWRRTWWMAYAFDAFYAGTLGTFEFNVMHIDATVDLPCEDDQYESGNIPEPRTLRDWDCREFDEENKPFSSFAYLIGAVRSAALAKASTMREGSQKQSTDVIHAADSILDSWMILLPKVKKQVMQRGGEIDELMFQAHLLIHVVVIGFHRPLSDLKFNAVEDISSCARDPAPEVPTPDHINVHTVRVLRSVESQIALLSLPSRPFNHTPFTTCMISEGTLALLSACKFLLRGTELAIARDQIRLSIGCLKEAGALWPRTCRNVSQIQTIARHVLGIETYTPNKDTPGSATETQGNLTEAHSSSNSDIFSSIRDFDDMCGWYDIGELDPAMSWWTGNQESSTTQNIDSAGAQTIDGTKCTD